MKMGMQVVDLAGATGAADCIFERACPVVNAVHKMVGQEKGDGAENGRFIHRIQYLSKSSRETERPAFSMACNTKIRMAVGCISLLANRSK